MRVGYGILAGALALSNLFAAGLKFARTKEQLHTSGMAWVEDFSPATIKGIGVAELLGAIGLILSMMFWSSWGGVGGARRTTTTYVDDGPRV